MGTGLPVSWDVRILASESAQGRPPGPEAGPELPCGAAEAAGTGGAPGGGAGDAHIPPAPETGATGATSLTKRLQLSAGVRGSRRC